MTPIMTKIREICTYHGDEGTSGYLLSEEQFNQIEKLLDEAIEKTNKRWRDKCEKLRLTYNNVEPLDPHYSDGHETGYDKALSDLLEDK